jgi:pilus assembly protein CpaE
MRVFLIDDEKMYYKLLQPVLKKAGHTLGYANSGEEGLGKIAAFDPDVIILDIRLNDMTGFDIFERLHRDLHFSHVPVIFVTSYDDMESKLKALTIGGEDYLTKPFKPEELLARLEILARRREYLKVAETSTEVGVNSATIVTVHSLRGGVGCTSLAVNLGLAYNQLWERPTMLIDAVLTSGQVALFLNASPKATWKDLADKTINDVDGGMIGSVVNLYKEGICYVASPILPTPFESLNDIFPRTIEEFRCQQDFIVLDTPHDFSDVAVMSLDAADYILLVLAPEMGSLRAAICALKTYDSLGYIPDKVKIVLNNISPAAGIKKEQVEKAIGRQVDIELPFSQAVMQAINTGKPFLTADSTLPISMRVEDYVYTLSRDVLKNVPPAAPTSTWKNVTNRLKSKGKHSWLD